MLSYDEYMKQQKAFCDALEQLKQEVAQKRSDLAALGKTTVEQLDAQIPKLQAKINTLTAEVARLEGLAVTTAKQSDYDKNYWNTQYLNLRENLEKIHQERMEALDARESEQISRDKIHAESKVDLQAREQKLKEEKDSLKSNSDLLVNLHESFQKEKKENLEKVNKIMASLEQNHVEAKAKNEEADGRLKEIELQSEALAKAIQEANNTIATIGEAQKKLNEARVVYENVEKKELELKEFDAKLDEKNAIIIADAARNRNRSKELDHRELSLNQRETTLKIAQKELREGKV